MKFISRWILSIAFISMNCHFCIAQGIADETKVINKVEKNNSGNEKDSSEGFIKDPNAALVDSDSFNLVLDAINPLQDVSLTEEATNEDVSKEKKYNESIWDKISMPFIASFLGLILFSLSGIWYMNRKKKEGVKVNDKTNSSLTTTATGSAAVLSTVEQYVSSAGPYFSAEVQLSAGPRKSGSHNDNEKIDSELGEDVAGFSIKNNVAYFWVLDGTSDQDRLVDSNNSEYFSSRLLAQDIARHFMISIKDKRNSRSIDILEDSIKLVKYEWNQRVKDLSLDDTYKLKELINAKNNLQCSSTVVFGKIDLQGNIDICLSGDCSAITKPMIDYEKNNRRQSANLSIVDGAIKLDFNKPNESNCTVVIGQKIESVAVMSDGISQNTQNWLKAIQKIDLEDPKIKKIISNQRQLTYDDKAICLVQIEDNSVHES